MLVSTRTSSTRTASTRIGRALTCVALLALTPLAAPACDDGGDGTPPTGLELNIFAAPQAPDPFEGVAFIRLIMEGEGLLQPYTQVVPYAPGAQVHLDGVPFSRDGQRRQLVVEAWAANAAGQPSALVSRGRSLPVEVLPGQDARAFDVLLARVNTFLGLVATSSLGAQQLVFGRVGHAVTPTPSGELVISGGGVVSAAGAAWWQGSGFTQVHNAVESVSETTHELAPRSPLLAARAWHTGTALSSGQIIIAGGYNASGAPIRDVELYNPPGVLDGTAKPLQPLAVERAGHTATLIDEVTRTILFVGGDANGTWELWDPMNGTQGVRPLPDSSPRRHHTATTFFISGRVEPAVLIAGGESDASPFATAMLYDSVAKNMVPVGAAMPSGARTQHAAVHVPDRGFIYVIGGYTALDRSSATPGIDVFDIGTLGFIEGNEGFRMRTPRGGHSAALLPNNTVVISGGTGSEPTGTAMGPLASIEVIYEFLDATSAVLNIEVASSWNPQATAAVVPYMPAERFGHRAAALGNGMILLIGGAGGFGMVTPLTLYNPL